MAGSRSSSFKTLDYCYSPITVFKDGKKLTVPCGKCNGCLLHKANMLSQQLSLEVQSNPYSIFFTLTYNNKYVPKLLRVSSDTGKYFYISDHASNIRFNGSKDVLRKDHIIISHNYFNIPLENLGNDLYIGYSSKSDIQLWLKLVRQSILLNLNPNEKSKQFRYFIISEYGPTTYRPHVHGILFPKSREIAEYLIHESMFANWQMSDKVRFDEYCTYTDSGSCNYVTNYVTSFARLPKLLQSSEIRCFRLHSVSPSVGFASFDKKEVLKNVELGIIEFNRTIPKAGFSSVLRYPSSYISRLFPKCYHFDELPLSRLYFVYGYLYRQIRGYQRPCLLLSVQLRQTMSHASDFEATRACYEVCDLMGWTPFHYLYVLDLYYYKIQMLNLKYWYSWQELHASDPVSLLSSYNNIIDYVKQKAFLSPYQVSALVTWFIGFGVDFLSFTVDDCFSLRCPDTLKKQYIDETDSICDNLVKMPKFNELSGKFQFF